MTLLYARVAFVWKIHLHTTLGHVFLAVAQNTCSLHRLVLGTWKVVLLVHRSTHVLRIALRLAREPS